MILLTSSISTLTFDPLRTSHNGIYSCVGTLTSPALDTQLMPSVVKTLYVQSEIYWKSVFNCLTTYYSPVSTPDVFIDVPRRPLFAGRIAPLTLTCYIYITNATDTDVVVMDNYRDVWWFRGNPLISDPMQPLSSTGDYEFNECLAYIPVTTTCIHGNTSKPMGTPSVQPTTAAAVQDDQK